MTILGPGGNCFHKTWNDGLGPLFVKNIGPGFWLGLELGLGLGGFVRSLGWEARFSAFWGLRFSDPCSDCIVCYTFNVICYMLYVICYMLYVTWYMVYGIRYMLYGIRYVLYFICYTLYVICYML